MERSLLAFILAVAGCACEPEPAPPRPESGVPAWIVPLARGGTCSEAHSLDGLLDVSTADGRPVLVPREEREDLWIRRMDERIAPADGEGPLELRLAWASGAWRGCRRLTAGRSVQALPDDWADLFPIRAWRSDRTAVSTRAFRRWLHVRDYDVAVSKAKTAVRPIFGFVEETVTVDPGERLVQVERVAAWRRFETTLGITGSRLTVPLPDRRIDRAVLPEMEAGSSWVVDLGEGLVLFARIGRSTTGLRIGRRPHPGGDRQSRTDVSRLRRTDRGGRSLRARSGGGSG